MRTGLFLLLFLQAVAGFATHIVGGELYYTSLGNDDYQVTLKLYRDCGPGNTNNTALDAIAALGVFDHNGALLTTYHFDLPGEESVPVNLGNPCLTAPPTICAKQGLYTGVMHLPSGTGGYTISYQRCCRTPTILNLNIPGSQGLTCTVVVPDPTVSGANSSPAFDVYPPIALCLQQHMVIDHSAVDPDGDELHYELCAPFLGGDNSSNVTPDPPAPPPYIPVMYAAGYSGTVPMQASSALAIDANTGELTLTPSMIGSFVVGVRVKEFRNGVLLSQVTRDFRFDVVACSVSIISSIQDQDSFCGGTSVQMNNESTGGNFYHWDFGVPNSAIDTSNLAEPLFVYPDTGVYTITLIANPGWPCADTSFNTFHIYDPVHVDFTPPPVLCPDQMPVQLHVNGNFSNNANVQWNFGDGLSPNPHALTASVSFAELGTHVVSVSVSENGCTGTYEDSVRVFPLPSPLFTVDTSGCVPHVSHFDNRSSAWTPMSFAWDFGDGSTATDSLPEHTYAAPGVYGVSLTVATDSGCIATRTLALPDLVEVWPLPVADAFVDPAVTSLLHPVVTVTDGSLDAVTWDFLVEDTHYNTPQFTHTFSDAGVFNIVQTVTNEYGCQDTKLLPVFVGDHLFFAPTAFSPNGDAYNEVWKPSVKGARFYRLEVFDRWGAMVFSTTDPQEGWDGKDAPIGTYGYKAWLSEWGPLDKEYNGTFTLIR